MDHSGSANVETLTEFGIRTRGVLRELINWLEALENPQADDERGFVYTWQLTLATIAWDVSEAALTLGSTGSIRAARMLNRSLAEYAFRAHRYGRSPRSALKDGSMAAATARKVMLPTKKIRGEMMDAQYAAFKEYLEAGPTQVTFQKVRKLMTATLHAFGVQQKTFDVFLQWFEVEYTLGSGLIHGSIIAILDSFRKGSDRRIERGERSLHFQRDDELVRTISCLVVLIAAVEFYHGTDFGGRQLVKELEEQFFHKRRSVTVWQHNALLPLIGVRRS
jgi:hypothetical protein